MNKPYSEACDENKIPILEVIEPLFRGSRSLLEIGSGTGQHAVYFAAALPGLTWQTSDSLAHLPGIRLWLEEAGLPNLPPPLALDVTGNWPTGPYDGVFSANTAHIMGKEEVSAMFRGVGRVLAPGGRFPLYGPFSRGGRHTSESNARFDAWLRARDPRMGVRDLDDLRRLGEECGLELVQDVPMPVNNRTLIWERVTSSA
jgi:cyclopropane fatty-acyl-phospholipid synthase-like methyltransferase